MLKYLYYGKSQYFLKKRNWAKATLQLEKAIAGNDNCFPKWHYQLGFLYSKLRKWELAEKQLKIATSKKMNNQRWNYRRAIALDNIQRKSEAADVIDSVFITNGSNSQKHFKSGVLLLGFSRAVAAEKAFRKAAELDGNKYEYYDKLAESLNKQRKWWQEVEALIQATKINDKKSELFFKLGAAFLKMNNFTEAERAFEKSIKLGLSNAESFYNLGYCLEKNSNTHEADEAYKKAVALSKSTDVKKYGVAAFHKNKGLWPETACELEKVVQKNKKNADLIYNLAMAYDRSYQWEKAELNYKIALKIKPGNPNWNFRLGFVLERQEKFKDAARHYEMASRGNIKHNSHIFYRLGFVLYKIGQFENACLSFLMMRTDRTFINKTFSHKLFSTNPWTADEYHQRATELEQAGDLIKSNELFQKSLERKNTYNSEWYFKLGYSYFKNKKFSEACKVFLDTRIYSKAYGVSLEEYESKEHLKFIASYLEYYERLEIKNDYILLESFHGASVSCNPYAIYSNLRKRPEFKDFKFVWVIQNGIKTPASILRKKNVIVVIRNSDAYLRYLASAKYLINNVSFPNYFLRKEGQKYLNTWHGTPMKYLGKDIKDSYLSHANVARNLLQATHIISQNRYTNNILLERYDVLGLSDAIIAETGYPRTDITLNATKEELLAIKKRLNISSEDKVVLYAPTWRGVHGKASFDTTRLLDDLKAMSQSGYKIIFRGHHMMESLIANTKIPAIVAPGDIDTNLLISVADLLITDYSSIAFDYLALKRPILFYTYDIEDYKLERGLYIPPENFPGRICHEQSELSEAIILAIELGFDQKNIEKFDYFVPYEDGNSSSRVIDMFFFEKMHNISVLSNLTKKNILIYAGPFMPNGIATSAINLLHAINYDEYNVFLAVDVSALNGHDERLNMIKKLPEQVRVIGHSGNIYFTPEEKWVSGKFVNSKNFSSDEMKKTYFNSYQRDFYRTFGRKKIDAVINFEGYNTKWVSLFASITSKTKKSIIYQHNDMCAEFKLRFPYLECNFNLYNDYHSIISVSSATKELNCNNMTDVYNIPLEKFSFSDNLQNPNSVTILSSEVIDDTIFDNGKYSFVTLGRLSPEKDHEKLIRAFKIVHEFNPSSQLIILGDGPLKSHLTVLIGQLKLDDSVMLLGRKDNPFPYLKRSDCFVLSSNHEGQPMVLFEALILKKPIVATDIVGNRGVLGDDYGLLVDNSVDGLVNGMICNLENKIQKDNFDIDKYQKNAINMFYDIIN